MKDEAGLRFLVGVIVNLSRDDQVHGGECHMIRRYIEMGWVVGVVNSWTPACLQSMRG